MGVDPNAARLTTTGLDTSDVVVRHANVWLESSKIGRFTLGRGSVATDGIAEISVANTDVAAKMLNLEPFSTQFLFGAVNLPFDGGRRDVVRYDSPAMGGIIVSASWGRGDHLGPVNLNGEQSNVYDVAIRYGADLGDFRVAAGVGYRHEDYSVAGPLLLAAQGKSIAGSASVKHMPTGFFVNGAYGQMKDFAAAGSGIDLTGYHGQGGWEKNLTGFGATSFYGEWGRLKADLGGSDATVDMIGGGVVQSLDSAAMDLYISWRQYDASDMGMDDKVNTFIAGARLRF